MNMIIKNIYSAITILVLALLAACTGMDHYYQDMIKEGPIVYPGKVVGVQTFTGKNRIRFSMTTYPDPSVEKVWVKWTYRGVSDSLSADVTKGREYNTSDILLESLEEDNYTFFFTTVDSKGNRSVPFEIPANVYGENYQNAIQNIFVRGAKYEDGLLTLDLSTSSDSGALGSVFYYEGIVGEDKTLFVENGTETITIDDFKPASPLTYQSLFVPGSHALDTFYTNTQNLRVLNVVPLKNRAIPFQIEGRSGRWGTLADWITNDAIKVHNGYGGWDERNGNIFNVETGWGAVPDGITNGKIHQTFVLGPGTYTFKANFRLVNGVPDTWNEGQGDQVYLVVGKGAEIPDVEVIETSDETLGFVRILRSNSPDAFQITFTITDDTEVSVGFATTQPGGQVSQQYPDTSNGRHCNIESFEFFGIWGL
ncbi:DUF4998 domain-containing protein [Belliella marina]|uniref:DUF4998 domain-containing protein n=1 Tax=Belliella marina TaxID=1644146 RepID=A0ABW4VKY5_9BACT